MASGPAAGCHAMHAITFIIDRDSVCAGDDTEPHQATVSLPATVTLPDLIAAARRACPLASIAGGQATWLIDIGSPARCIGVIAQQWSVPQLLAMESSVAALCGDGSCMLHFRYWGQSDPQAVVDALRAGRPIPERAATG